MSAAVYVSGLPGIGKTTAVKNLVEARPDEYVRLSFGETLREVIASDESLEAFRGNATRTVSRAAIENATTMLAHRIRDEPTRVVLIDSHAVTPATEGLRATPDTAERLAAFGYEVIAHLSAAGAEERILRHGGSEGRTAIAASEIAPAETVQLSIVARYASLCDCPLYVLSASGTAEEVADRLGRAVTAGLRWRGSPP
ncbi:MAG: AAA family ATPase [Gaiellaceae bacterium]